jgi:predicted PurR-regulated permease PerM
MEQETPAIPKDAVLLDEESINQGRTRSANNKWLMVGAVIVLSLVILIALIIWLLNGMYSNMNSEIDANLQEIENLQDDLDLESMEELDNIGTDNVEQEIDDLLTDFDNQLDQIQNELDLNDFTDPGQ